MVAVEGPGKRGPARIVAAYWIGGWLDAAANEYTKKV